MPHRRGLGEKATDQRAETELGRLVLRGALDATLGLAGETYLALWRGYVWTLAGPRELAQGGGTGFTCGGCEQMRHCRCEFRKRIYLEAQGVLRAAGPAPAATVICIVVQDWKCPEEFLEPLRLGLGVLAHHFGLTPRANGRIGKCSISKHVPA